MAYNRVMTKNVREKTAWQTDDCTVSGKTKFHSPEADYVCFRWSFIPCQKNYFIRSGVRMISSGDISLNLKTWYVSWSKSNWASLMGGRPFRLALADELIWFMILSVSHWVSLSKLLPLRQPVLDGQPLQTNGALKRRLQVSGTKSLHTLLQLIFLRMEKINSDDNCRED